MILKISIFTLQIVFYGLILNLLSCNNNHENQDKELYILVENSSLTSDIELLIQVNHEPYDTIIIKSIDNYEVQPRIIRKISFKDSVKVLLLDDCSKSSFYKKFNYSDSDLVLYILGNDNFQLVDSTKELSGSYSTHFSILREIPTFQ